VKFWKKKYNNFKKKKETREKKSKFKLKTNENFAKNSFFDKKNNVKKIGF
jgi:hypothetical protein